jgi:hypothetical protein
VAAVPGGARREMLDALVVLQVTLHPGAPS